MGLSQRISQLAVRPGGRSVIRSTDAQGPFILNKRKWFTKMDRRIIARLFPLFSITVLIFAQTQTSSTSEISANFQALIWAELVFVLGLAYHAGITINRIKNIESRIEDVEETKASEKLAALTVMIDGLKTEFALVRETIILGLKK